MTPNLKAKALELVERIEGKQGEIAIEAAKVILELIGAKK